MFYNRNAENPFDSYVASWMEDANLADPFEQFFAYHRAEAAYLREEHGDEVRARANERILDLFEQLIESIGNHRVTYKQAAEIGVWAYGTVKNKARNEEIVTENGRVALNQIAIGPETRGLHALRVVEAVTNRRKADQRQQVDTDAKDAAIREAVDKARAKRQTKRAA